jgi:cell wall-associated NlpC family hydrolase
MMTEQDILKRYLGVPYKHQGRGLDGLDCYGLIISLYKEVGHELLDVENYPQDWALKDGSYFIENYYRQWEKMNIPKFLDVVGLKNKKGVFNHAGVMFDGNRFIHTCKAGTVVGSLSDWKDRIVGFYRLKERA